MSLQQNSRRFSIAISVVIFSIFTLPPQAHPQAIPAGSSNNAIGSRTASATTNDAGPTGIIPFDHGFNASLITTTQHDSNDGWSSILTPGMAYRFSPFFSLSASLPIYSSVQVETNTGTKAKPVYTSTTRHGVLGDTSLAAHLDTHPHLLDYNATFSLGLPSGNTDYGLSAGRTTYDFNNHFEKSFGIFAPDIEFGIGNSSNLVQTRVRKSYSSAGSLAHFQAGTSIDLPLNMSFEIDAYEQLPLSTSTIYSSTGRGKKKVTTATTVSAAEDNGLLTSLDVPFGGHVTLSGFYNHSIRSQDDVVGLSLTFLLKAPPKPDDIVR